MSNNCYSSGCLPVNSAHRFIVQHSAIRSFSLFFSRTVYMQNNEHRKHIYSSFLSIHVYSMKEERERKRIARSNFFFLWSGIEIKYFYILPVISLNWPPPTGKRKSTGRYRLDVIDSVVWVRIYLLESPALKRK